LRFSAKRTASSFALVLLAGGCVSPPLPADALAFGLLGDAPYDELEAQRLDGVIDAMNAQPLAFVVHVGDIGSSRNACNDGWLQARKAQFARIRHPFVLLPGDNEWTDCPRPLERRGPMGGVLCFSDPKI
jgi:hypothetical protein